MSTKITYWRTLIRFEGVAFNGDYFVQVPGWSTRRYVRVARADVPQALRERVASGEIRCHAKANIGASDDDDLYIKDWELE